MLFQCICACFVKVISGLNLIDLKCLSISKEFLIISLDWHVVTAPSQHNTYGNTAFPGITDALFDIKNDPDQDGRWNEVKRQYSIVIFHILSAAAILGSFV